jgi:hypothetical protein
MIPSAAPSTSNYARDTIRGFTATFCEACTCFSSVPVEGSTILASGARISQRTVCKAASQILFEPPRQHKQRPGTRPGSFARLKSFPYVADCVRIQLGVTRAAPEHSAVSTGCLISPATKAQTAE